MGLLRYVDYNTRDPQLLITLIRATRNFSSHQESPKLARSCNDRVAPPSYNRCVTPTNTDQAANTEQVLGGDDVGKSAREEPDVVLALAEMHTEGLHEGD